MAIKDNNNVGFLQRIYDNIQQNSEDNLFENSPLISQQQQESSPDQLLPAQDQNKQMNYWSILGGLNRENNNQQNQQQPQIIQQQRAQGYEPKSTGFDPRTLAFLNPYNNAKVPSINSAPFLAEKENLNLQGKIAGEAQKNKAISEENIFKKQEGNLKEFQQKSRLNEEQYRKASQQFEENLDKVNREYPSLSRQDVIDKMGTGQKIMYAIAGILEGVGNGLSGRNNNQVVNAIDQHIDSEINKQNQMYQKGVESLKMKQAKSVTDFEMIKQNLNDNYKMNSDILQTNLQQIKSIYERETSPITKLQLENAGNKIMQQLGAMQQQTAMQQFQLELQSKSFLMQAMQNPRTVNVGVDKAGRPILALAASDESAKKLRETIPAAEQKIKSVSDMIRYLDVAKDRKEMLKGNNLEGMKENIAKQFGLKADDLPDPLKTFGGNSLDFYNQLLQQAVEEKDSVIRVNTIK